MKNLIIFLTTLIVAINVSWAETSLEASILPQDSNVWSEISSDLSLPDNLANEPRVQAEIKKILADKQNFESILNAATPFIYYIHNEVHEKGLPDEVTLIPIIESQFDVNDHSSTGATSLWQLMPGTARLFGITVSGNNDGRHNLIDSTNAALSYFKDLDTVFKGNWMLAAAAYNSGQGTVQSAVKRAKTTNFFSLNVPTETKYYVPRLIAVAEIIKDPQKYGITLPQVENQPYFSQVMLDKTTNVKSFQEENNLDAKLFYILNREYKNVDTIPKGSVVLVKV